MIQLTVFIEINGTQTRVGTIRGNDRTDACFAYDAGYLDAVYAAPVSVRLPLRDAPFSPEETQCFFEGLLPEAFTRRSVAAALGVDETDYLSLLAALGRDCIGAIRILDDAASGEPASYRKLTPAQLRSLMSEGAAHAAGLQTKSRLSLAGASGKTSLYYDEKKKSWYLPAGDAPGTHIVKQSHVRLSRIVVNELLCMRTAKSLGLDVAESSFIAQDISHDDGILYATKRFDRRIADNAPLISGHARPDRLHQEDFAQALGIPSAEKYEKEGQHHLRDMFTLLRTHVADPVADQMKLWDLIIFNTLIGNADHHVKNFSLLYSGDLRTIRLAPAYDLLSTAIYRDIERRGAFHIGGETSPERQNRAAFERAAGDAGLGRRAAMARYDDLHHRFPAALQSVAKELSGLGFPDAEKIGKDILHGRR